jgi:maltokinase
MGHPSRGSRQLQEREYRRNAPRRGRHLRYGPEVTTTQVADELRAAWPPLQTQQVPGRRSLELDRLRPLDVLVLPAAAADPGSSVLVVVAGDAEERVAAVPCIRRDGTWLVASPGDGVAAALVQYTARTATREPTRVDRFELQRFRHLSPRSGIERAIDADQSNSTVIVAGEVVVKWRTVPATAPSRGLSIRQHLGSVGFREAATLVGTLAWHGADGRRVDLAELDGYLPGAVDGWDHYIARLTQEMTAGPSAVSLDIGTELGRLTADLHVALATASVVFSHPVSTTAAPTIRAWQAQAQETITRACEIPADDRSGLLDREDTLRAQAGRLGSIDRTAVQVIHGDYHLGQVIAWAGGLAVIDFDGPPDERSGRVGPQPTARDVAQMLCSLDHLAAIVERRTTGRFDERLWRWADDARARFLDVYRDSLVQRGALGSFDQRLLPAFIAEQLCHELLYAAGTLPRWRYAPMRVLQRRYRSVTS